MEKKSYPVSLGATLIPMFHEINIEDKMKHYMIHDTWCKAVGAKIAEQTYPERVRNDVLIVNVSNSVWMQELHFLTQDILEKINNKLENCQLKDIRFRIGKLPRLSRKRGPVILPSLENRELKNIEERASLIKDEDVRQSFQRVMEASMKSKKGRNKNG